MNYELKLLIMVKKISRFPSKVLGDLIALLYLSIVSLTRDVGAFSSLSYTLVLVYLHLISAKYGNSKMKFSIVQKWTFAFTVHLILLW